MKNRILATGALLAGGLTIYCSGIYVVSELFLPHQNGFSYLVNESMRKYGEGDDIVDTLLALSMAGALMGSVSSCLLLAGSELVRKGAVKTAWLVGLICAVVLAVAMSGSKLDDLAADIVLFSVGQFSFVTGVIGFRLADTTA